MSWEIGAFLDSLICAVFSYPILKIRHYGIRIVAVLVVPYLKAQALYWGISFIKGASEETASWSGLFVGTWSAVGLIALLVGPYVSWQISRRHKEKVLVR